MTLTRGVLARQPYASGDGVGIGPPPGQQTPPPIPGGTATFVYIAQTGVGPLALRTLAGYTPAGTYPGGGIIVSPMAATGTMSVTAWWPDAPVLLLLRVTPDGALTPVRGGYPATPSAATRRNLCPNPSAEAGLNGYAAGTGTPTLSSTARLGDPSGGVLALRATVAGAGTNEVTIPTTLTGVAATIGLDVRFSARPTAVTVTVGWTSATGGALTPSVVTLSADEVNTSVSQWGRQAVTVTPPTGATASTTKITATGMSAGGTMDLDRVMIEAGSTVGSYVDGSVLGGIWTGTTALSTSVVAPIVTVSDGEAPLDVALSYILYGPGVTGGRMLSPPAVLSTGDTAWITHPARPSAPVAVQPTITPVLTHALDQATFRVLGRTNPVVVSSANRIAPSGSITLDAPAFADRDVLLGLLADGSPMLLRTPQNFGYGYGMWLAFGDVVEDPGERAPWQQTRALTAPIQVVDPPAAANSVIV